MTQTTLTAQEIFRAAYDNRYTWDKGFPGFQATVTLTDADVTHTGRVQVNPDMTFEVLDIQDEAARRLVKSQLWEMTIHRANRSFEESHGDNTFDLGSTDDHGAIEILVGGASMGNRYKVRDNIVCFVHRQIRDVIVNIHTFETQQTETGYLSTGYRSIYLDPQTQLPKDSETVFKDTFEQVGGYWLLSHRTIQESQADEVKTTEVGFSRFQLL
ncbi:DUF3386 domain-containing protein [Leptolyngbya iicbica]|uniref:DUF3386 domain-containing protein n=2 Tax=Cyanophyceae TaxID=3028117 RepID=A0A4Q7E1U2_9CYAN|nr:DUF3386 domain-containing protein [Leptolyngbya sp. LK]RZM75291.1 DUF3386 domain-containing protein [Leptolyngbya sp. LK]